MESIPNMGDGELSISEKVRPSKFQLIDDGIYEGIYKGFAPYHDTKGTYGEKKGVRLMFEIAKGPFAKSMISTKSNFVQDSETGEWIIGKDTRLAHDIKTITGGSPRINPGHIGNRVYLVIKKSPSKKDPSKIYSNIDSVMPLPDGTIQAPVQQAPVQQAPVQQAPVQQAPVQQAPVQQAPMPTAAPVKAAAKPAPVPVGNPGLLNELSDLADFDKL